MKIRTTAILLLGLAWAGFARAATNDVTTLVQKGLFEEEANHHLDAAIEYYQEAIGHFDKDREVIAAAIFHLGECYRLQGNTSAANEQYQRIVREFPDQTQLVELSRGYLPKGGATLQSSFTQNLTRTSGPGLARPLSPGEMISPDEQNELRKIRDMIQNSPDLITSPGGSLLTEAAREGWMSAAKLLLDNGAIINPTPTGGRYSPLTQAADAGNKGMVEFLLSKGADVNAMDRFYNRAPLHYAVAHGFKTVAETLLAHGADVNVQAGDGDRPLHYAASRDFLSMAELLLEHHADVNAPGNVGETPIFRAIQNNHLDMVQFLISNKADVNIKSKEGKTPLLAGMGGDTGIAIVQTLLDAGANLETLFQGRPPLDHAIVSSRNDLVELFLQRHANPNLADLNGINPLDYAIEKSDTNVIAELISDHADVNAPDKNGDPPLAYASRLNNGPPGSFYPGVRSRSPSMSDIIKEMLIAAGANEDYLRREGIFLAQKGSGSIGNKVFYKDANHYTLFEFIAKAYSPDWRQTPVSYPDFAQVTINRLKAGGSKEDIAVNLDEMLQSGDCSKNPALEWGDVVLIPQRDHRVNDRWGGLSRTERGTLGKCLMRQVKIVVKGQTTQVALLPLIVQTYVQEGGGYISDADLPVSLTSVLNGAAVLYSFNLNTVVHQANVLLISSDLSDVGVTRRHGQPGEEPLFLHLNLETPSPLDFQLEDGDVITIPERK